MRPLSSAAPRTRPEPSLHIPLAERIELAEAALRNMGLTHRFARLILLCGHGSTTNNNPYASSLACGACGGHAGDANARVAAALLNDREVRTALTERRIAIPDETVFVAGLHDTTTDAVRLCDTDLVPKTHVADLLQLELWLDEAGQRVVRDRPALEHAVRARWIGHALAAFPAGAPGAAEIDSSSGAAVVLHVVEVDVVEPDGDVAASHDPDDDEVP